MTTRITDIIVPEVFTPYMLERTKELSALFQSGIVSSDAELQENVQGGGRTVEVPFFKDLTGSSESDDDDPANPATPDKITTGQDTAHKHFRRKAWGSADLAASLAGADPMGQIANLTAGWWARDMQKSILVPTLTGVFATALSGTHVHDVAIEDGNNATATNLIGSDAVIDAAGLLGDAWMDITAIVMHSTPYQRLTKLDLIEFRATSEQDTEIPFYLGRRVIVDDGCPRVAGVTSGFKYTSYLFGNDALAFGEGNPKVPTETDRDSLAGVEYLITRRHFVLHPRGVRWTGTVLGKTPSQAELEAGASWSKVYADKNIRLIKLVTNG